MPPDHPRNLAPLALVSTLVNTPQKKLCWIHHCQSELKIKLTGHFDRYFEPCITISVIICGAGSEILVYANSACICVYTSPS
jgi:hypothetical protein